jgi:hypothetical protein
MYPPSLQRCSPVSASTEHAGNEGQPASADRQKHLRQLLAEEAFGWCGAAALLAAFGLSATGVLPSSSFPYLALNLIGAIGLAYTSFSRRAYPPAVLNIIWAAVAALSLVVLVARI